MLLVLANIRAKQFPRVIIQQSSGNLLSTAAPRY